MCPICRFSGLATDELFLIKAECLARAGNASGALSTLNDLLRARYAQGTFVDLHADDPQQALRLVLQERRKELVFRGIRWSDLRRLNKEGAGIVLTRLLNGKTYTLPANSNKYTLPIPPDEIALNGIEQNPR